jgi:hypothetical protein
MTTKTKIIIGLVVLASAATGYYFLVYKPKKDKEKSDLAGGKIEGVEGTPTGIIQGTPEAEALETSRVREKGYWKTLPNGKKEWYHY